MCPVSRKGSLQVRRHAVWLVASAVLGLIAIPVFANLANSGFDAGDGTAWSGMAQRSAW